ncbi:hypothetical protein C8J56DRAFT_544547 [Mycena floridula]|nr:hypothetical protein C8J56DRAFT_544547 [Mycena floridula]
MPLFDIGFKKRKAKPVAKPPLDRAVQWLDGGQEPVPQALDERALDTQSLDTLMNALERHKSTEGPTRIHPKPPEPNINRQALPSLRTSTYPPDESQADAVHASFPQDIPGTFVDEHEKSGLPDSNDLDQQATTIVRAHTRKSRPGFLGFSNTARDKFRVKARDYADVEARQSLLRDAPGGVLSTLLTLYNDDPSTGLSSRASAATLLDEEKVATRPTFSRQNTEESLATINSSPTSPSETKSSLGRSFETGSTSLFGIGSRPPQTRNGAGVFGSLIASTGNLSGLAAPTPSQLQPNLKRPGYHLSRYSYEDTLPSSSKPSRSADRPKSAHFDIPDALPIEDSSRGQKRPWSGVLKDFACASSRFGSRSDTSTPARSPSEEWPDDRWFVDKEKDRRRKRKKAEIYITRHVAEILQRQDFVMKLARSMMMYGAPSHRLQSQLQSTARVLDIDLSCMFLPDVMLISFDDATTATSQIKLIKQPSTLDLGKLKDAYSIYWKVIHDDLSVSEASTLLSNLMQKPQMYNWWQLMLIGGMCSASICTVSFAGSLLDALAAFPLGTLLVGMQLLSVRHELYSNIFEISIATLCSLLSAALASTHHFCYSAVASSAVVLILPGFIVLCGSLELMSRSIVSGSVRMCYAVIYALFLGFGLAMGTQAFEKMSGKVVTGTTDYSCSETHSDVWYQKTPSTWWAFLTVPMYSLFLSMRIQAPLNKEMLLLIGIASVGWVTNHFTGLKFVNQSDISSAFGAFAVGLVANLYGRFVSDNAFVIMITGILFQVASGLGPGGLFTFVSQQSRGTSSTTAYISGFQTALQLISVSIGLAVGLGFSLFLTHPIQSRRRAGGIFSL